MFLVGTLRGTPIARNAGDAPVAVPPVGADARECPRAGAEVASRG